MSSVYRSVAAEGEGQCLFESVTESKVSVVSTVTLDAVTNEAGFTRASVGGRFIEAVSVVVTQCQAQLTLIHVFTHARTHSLTYMYVLST